MSGRFRNEATLNYTIIEREEGYGRRTRRRHCERSEAVLLYLHLREWL